MRPVMYFFCKVTYYLHIPNESQKKACYCLNKSIVQSFYYLKAVTSSIPLAWPNTSVVQMYEFAILIWATKQNEFVFIYIRILVFGNTFYIFFCVWLIFDLTPLETVPWYYMLFMVHTLQPSLPREQHADI